MGSDEENTELLESSTKQRLTKSKTEQEEAYVLFLNRTKDHRITHLLKQTNDFLDSSSKAVASQQACVDDSLIENENEVDNSTCPVESNLTSSQANVTLSQSRD